MTEFLKILEHTTGALSARNHSLFNGKTVSERERAESAFTLKFSLSEMFVAHMIA